MLYRYSPCHCNMTVVRAVEARCAPLSAVNRACRQSRPSPSAATNLVLRRRTSSYPRSTSSPRWHSTSPTRLSETSLVSTITGLDDAYLPFDLTTSRAGQSATLPDRLSPASCLPPASERYHEGKSSAYFGQHPGQSTPYEPSIELRPDLKELPTNPNARVTANLDVHRNETSASRPASQAASRISRKRPTTKQSSSPDRAPTDTRQRTSARTFAKPYEIRKSMQSSKREVRLSHSEIKRESEIIREPWQIQKRALREKFQDGSWDPRKKVSPDAMEGIRALHAQYPKWFPTAVLADQFKVSPEAIRRILKSKWRPNAEQEEDRRLRWDKRGEKIWTKLVDQGVHPPKRWRTMGIGTGPRRPGQDRSRGQRDVLEPESATDCQGTERKEGNEGSAWLWSLASRLA